MIDLHRHDEFSTFDGFGKAEELAVLAKELGHTALCTTNHGNTNGLIRTYLACKEVGIKAILGVEGYFLPKYKEKERGYHLILVAKNLKGYGNLNRLQYEGEKHKFYNPIWDFEMLEKYHEGLICTTACVAGYLAQCIIKNKMEVAEKYLLKLKKIFKDDLYIEVQPYKISEKGIQEKVNIESIKLADKLGIKCILTSDSHRGRKEELESYMKMHEIAGHNQIDIEETYAERYMPTEKEIVDRFILMHTPSMNGNSKYSIDATLKRAKQMIKNLEEIDSKCELNYLDDLKLQLPKVENKRGKSSLEVLISEVKKGLKERGKYTQKYIKRCKEELEVIKYHGFEDYFLIVSDYVRFAKNRGIVVGPGRGSVCNCLIAYALHITEVDSLYFGLDFRRFLRIDKKSFPDIDLDFQTSRRHEVIEYLVNKYKGHAARICSYGLYKVDNLINDLAKVCGLETDKGIDEEKKKINKAEIAAIKKLVNNFVDESVLDVEGLMKSNEAKHYNKQYNNIILHFIKLFKKVRFIGTHAAGVAITGGNLLDYVALKIDKNGDIYTNYDLNDVEQINVIKFDVLGLKTMESISDLRKSTGITVNYDEIVKDEKILESFREGKCDGVFQFEKATARNILNDINCDCFDDVVAASSMNRPGPLSLKMPEAYANNKMNQDEVKNSKYWEYTKESYGTIIYQEQIQQIAVYIGGMEWADADKIMKLMKNVEAAKSKDLKKFEETKNRLSELFLNGAVKNGYTKQEAQELFNNMMAYTFNKGHGVGYSLISVEEMFYKVYYPNEYWFCKLKYARDDAEFTRFCEKAVADGSVIFLPHVNYSTARTRLRRVDGDNVIQQGLSSIKGVGEKAADYIYEERKKNGVFISYDDFYDRCKSRVVTSRVIEILKQNGMLDFNKKTYLKRVVKYNRALYVRAMQ